MRRRDEKGAVAAMMAGIVTVLVVVAAFAVDIGMHRVARRDMQALADAVALDLARLLDGRSASAIRAGGAGKAGLDTVKAASYARNNDNLFGDAPAGCSGGACVNAYLVDLDPMGGYAKTGGVPVEVAGSAVPDGVVVMTTTDVAFAFAGVVGVDDGSASRSAIGIAQSAACIQLGSYAASISPSSSALFGDLLRPLLGSSTLGMVGYNGLATADLSMLDLISAPSIGAGTVSEALAVQNVTVADVFLAAASVLQSEGRLAEASVFQSASASLVAAIEVDLGDLLGVSTGASNAVLETRLNALDLLIGTVFLANGENFLALPNLQAGLPSVGVTNTELKIIEKRKRHCLGDPTNAETSQIKLSSDLKVEPNNSPLVNTTNALLRIVNASTGSPDATLNMHLDVDIAGAHGRLTQALCDPAAIFDFDVWTDLATLSLEGSARVKGSVKATVLGLVGTDIPVEFDISVAAYASRPAGTAPVHGTLAIPPLTYNDHVSVGPGDVLLPNVTVTMKPGTLKVGPVTVKVLGLPVVVDASTLLAAVNPILAGLLAPTGELNTRLVPLVQPIVDKVNDILLQLNAALGINMAGADVYGLKEPSCAAPALYG